MTSRSKIDIPIVLGAPEPAPVSIVTLAGELGEPLDQLAGRLGDDVFIEERTSLRCVSVDVCAREVGERDRRAAAVERLQREQMQIEIPPSPPRARDERLEGFAARGMGGRP